MLQYWWSRRQLIVHPMGNLFVELQIDGMVVRFEITEREPLELFQYGTEGPRAIIDYLVPMLGVDPDLAKLILERASAVVRVDTLAVPNDPGHWQPDVGLDPRTVLRREAPGMIGVSIRAVDSTFRREPGRVRSKDSRRLLEELVRMGRASDMSDSEIARKSSVPRETIRDVRRRLEREQVAKASILARGPRGRLDADQVQAVLAEIDHAKGNAAEAARRLGLPERTVRGIRSRAAERVVEKRVRPDADMKRKLFELVRSGMSPTEASRRLGMSDRTARGWVRKARLSE